MSGTELVVLMKEVYLMESESVLEVNYFSYCKLASLNAKPSAKIMVNFIMQNFVVTIFHATFGRFIGVMSC